MIRLLLLSLCIFMSCQSDTTNDKKSSTLKNEKEALLFVGTYTKKEGHVDGKADGIYILKFDTLTGQLSPLDTIKHVTNPSYISIHPNQKHLYAVNELADDTDQNLGTVSGFNIEDINDISLLYTFSSEGDAPCHIDVDASGKYVLTANYVSGTITSTPIDIKGGLVKATSIVKEERTVPEVFRQEASHPHMVYTGIANSVLVPDLGTDKVVHFKLSENGQLNRVTETKTTPQSGPRHLDFHPNKKWCYVLNELNQTIELYQFRTIEQPMKRLQSISTLQEKVDTGYVFCGAIHMHPSGQFLYASNRGVAGNTEQSIARYRVNQDNGTLEFLGLTPSQGNVPRDFAIDPTGNFLLVANQDSDSIITFKIDHKTGNLMETTNKYEVSTPVCLKFTTL